MPAGAFDGVARTLFKVFAMADAVVVAGMIDGWMLWLASSSFRTVRAASAFQILDGVKHSNR